MLSSLTRSVGSNAANLRRATVALLSFTIAVSLVSCARQESSGDLSEVTGYWRGALASQTEMNMELVFRINEAGPRALEATGYWLLDGSINNEFPVARVVYRGEEGTLELSYADVTYVARVDAKLGIARGAFGSAGLEEELLMTRVDSDALEELTPRSGVTGADYTYRKPEQLDDGWETASLGDAGFDADVAVGAVRGVLDGEYGFITSFLVIRDGRLVLEEYFYGAEREDLEMTMSVTKSVVSLLVGVAVDDGLIESVGAPILSYFPERRATAADGWEIVTLEHVLTMSTGAEWPSEVKQGGYVAPSDRFSGVLERPIKETPGTTFDYVGLNVELLAGVLETATGVHADVYARDALFEPLGIEEYDWSNMKWEGHPLIAGALKLKPRDMARFGQLVLNGGAWGGQRVVSEEWIERSTTTQIGEVPGSGYGYLWWIGSFDLDGRVVDAIFASGLGSNYVAVLPELDLVVVTTGRNVTNGLHQAPLDMVGDHLLPALSGR